MSATAASDTASDVQHIQRERMAFLGLDAKALAALKSIKPIIDRELPRALDKFYAKARTSPQMSALLRDDATVQRARAAQIEHWGRLSGGDLEGRAAETSRRVGETHAKLGVSPDMYISSYALLADHLLSAVITEIWPKGALRRGRFARGADAALALSALQRVVMLDLDMGVIAYLEALDRRRQEAEQKAARVEEETQSAIGHVREALGQLAAKKLDAKLSDRLPQAFQQMASDFNSAMSGLREAMQSVQGSLATLNTSTNEIATATQDLSSRTEHEASSIEQSSAAIEEVTLQVNKTAQHAQTARAIVTQAGAEAQQSNEVVAQAIAAMGRIEKSSNDIGKIIGAIDEIAFQTNLLALNAGVEAARAGDAGRGFAVVASEVRGLAQRSAEAAKEIKALVATATSEVNGGVDLVSATGEALARIGAKVTQMSGVVSEILSSAQQQASSLGEIKAAVGELSSATQQNAAMAEESTAASRSLARETGVLSDLIAQFKLGGGAPAPMRRAAPPASARPSAPAPRRDMAPAPRPRAAATGGGGSADWKEF